MTDELAADVIPPGRHLLFDTETNGLMPSVNTVHCLGFADIRSGELFSFPPDNIEEGLRQMYDADVLSGHNIIQYDFKVLKKVYNWNPRPGTRVIDTMILARLKHSDIKRDDMKSPDLIKLGLKVGGHRLKDWGIRLGEHKAEYDGGWEVYTPEMLAYMMQDVKTNVRLLQHLKAEEYPRAPLELEQRVAEVCYQMEQAGWTFDSRRAKDLYVLLCQKRDELEARLVDGFGSWQEIDRVVVPKRPNVARGYTGVKVPILDVLTDEPVLDAKGRPTFRFEGTPVTIWKTVTFNPGSRQHIELKLREAGWEPEEFTPTGRAMINDEILEDIKLPNASGVGKDLMDYLLIQKRLGTIADGPSGWLKKVQSDGRIHGKCMHIGTPHFRASHFDPNVGQVPNEHSLYGPECRECWVAPEGWLMVGADMEGCQLRGLGHYIAAFDKGAYAKMVAEGDIHTYHMEAAAPYIKSRDTSKTTIYAMIFGSAGPRIGKINGENAAIGYKIIAQLKSRIPGFGKVTQAVEAACAKGWLKAIDGRHVPVRSKHSALNFLITSSEAILCKTWLTNAYEELIAKYRWGYDGDFVICGWVHDEIQVACRPEIAEDIAAILVKHAVAAGDVYGFRTKLASKSKIGRTWRDTH